VFRVINYTCLSLLFVRMKVVVIVVTGTQGMEIAISLQRKGDLNEQTKLGTECPEQHPIGG